MLYYEGQFKKFSEIFQRFSKHMQRAGLLTGDFFFLIEGNIRCLLFQHPKKAETLVFLESIRFNHWEVKSFNFKGPVVC